MKLRDMTTAELFPLAYQQDLLKKQSEHFVSNALSEGNFESGYKNIPTGFSSVPENLPIVLNSKPPQFLIGTFFKHNWRPLLVFFIIGGVSTYVYLKSKEKKKKKSVETKTPKTLYYPLAIKSI